MNYLNTMENYMSFKIRFKDYYFESKYNIVVTSHNYFIQIMW